MMWFAVCWSAPQSLAGLLDRPHLHISALKRPTPVWSLFCLTQACRGRSDPWLLLDGEGIYSRSLLVDGCHSTDHILAIQWAFVLLGRVVDRMSSPLVAKGRRDFSLCFVSSLVMVWWRRWSGSMARQASARFAARLRSSAGVMPASTGSCSTGVGCKHPAIVRKVQFRLTSKRLVCLLLLHTGAQYSTSAYSARGRGAGCWWTFSPSRTHKFTDECTTCHDLFILQDIIIRCGQIN